MGLPGPLKAKPLLTCDFGRHLAAGKGNSATATAAALWCFVFYRADCPAVHRQTLDFERSDHFLVCSAATCSPRPPPHRSNKGPKMRLPSAT